MDIIERAARAIVTRNWPSLCEADVSEMWPDHVEDARAVLMAIREPDEGMIDAGSRLSAMPSVQRKSGNALKKLNAGAIWQAMIDEALREK